VRRLLPHFIQAGQESVSRSAIVLGELPLPNQSTLQILLETLHRCSLLDAYTLPLGLQVRFTKTGPPSLWELRGLVYEMEGMPCKLPASRT
jgi:hypothetical protein